MRPPQVSARHTERMMMGDRVDDECNYPDASAG
jgi:hypothetical protein